MRKISTNRIRLFKGLNSPYRMVFISEDTLEEVGSFRLTKGSVYTLASTLFVLTIVVTVLILVWTPLRYYIPGYGSSADRTEVLRLKSTVDSLSDLSAAQTRHAAAIHDIIAGKAPLERDTAMLDMKKVELDRMNSILPQPEEVRAAALRTGKDGKKRK